MSPLLACCQFEPDALMLRPTPVPIGMFRSVQRGHALRMAPRACPVVWYENRSATSPDALPDVFALDPVLAVCARVMARPVHVGSSHFGRVVYGGMAVGKAHWHAALALHSGGVHGGADRPAQVDRGYDLRVP